MNRQKLTLIAFFILGLTAYLPHAARAVTLKDSGSVSGEAIMLGDVFTGLEKGQEHTVLGAAPRPGQNMTLDARTLTRIATALNLNWSPSTGGEQITLSRAATIIDRDMIESTIKTGLTAQGVDGAFNLIIPADNLEMVLPQSTPQNVEISSLKILPDQERFEAVLAAPSKAHPLKNITVHGTLERLVSVPVLQAPLQGGTIIGQGDLDFIDMPAKTLGRDVIIKAEDLEGMSPRHMLQAGKPIKNADIQAPKIVERGDLVTVILNQKGLSLTTQGKAMEHGAKGDTIRVVNAASNKTFEATVTGEKEVTIQSF